MRVESDLARDLDAAEHEGTSGDESVRLYCSGLTVL